MWEEGLIKEEEEVGYWEHHEGGRPGPSGLAVAPTCLSATRGKDGVEV